MRTTINVDDYLLAEAKLLAHQSGKTLTAVIEEALRERLARRHTPSVEARRLPTFRGSGPLPGVDIDNSASLRDLMDATS